MAISARKAIKFAAWLLGTITVGALSNPVWEFVFRPTFSWFGRFMLDLATLGIAAFKDTMYREVAKGFHEAPSVAVYFAVMTAVAVLYIAIPASMWMRDRRFSSSISGFDEEIINLEKRLSNPSWTTPDREIQEQIAHIRVTLDKSRIFQRYMKRLTAFSLIAGIAVSASCFVGASRERYINSAISNFKQSLTICAPAMTSAEVNQFESRFAAIRTRADYVEVLARIHDSCGEQKPLLPPFDVW